MCLFYLWSIVLSKASIIGLETRKEDMEQVGVSSSAKTSQDQWRHVDLSGAILTDVCFRGVNLQGSNFTGATLRNVIFDHCNLSAVNFTSADLTNANLSHTWLDSANFYGADLTNAKFDGAAIFSTTVLENIRCANVMKSMFCAAKDECATSQLEFVIFPSIEELSQVG